jgi:hypothetical protein
MKISTYTPFTKEPFFETARDHSILHPERIVRNRTLIPRNVGEARAFPPQKQFCQNIYHRASCAGPRQQQAFKHFQFGWLGRWDFERAQERAGREKSQPNFQ